MSLKEALEAIKESDLADINADIEAAEKALNAMKELRKIMEIKLRIHEKRS